MTPGYYIQVSIALAVVLGMLWLFQRVGRSIYEKKYAGEIVIADRTVVDANVAFVILNIRGKEYLVGTGNREIQVFEELDPS